MKLNLGPKISLGFLSIIVLFGAVGLYIEQSLRTQSASARSLSQAYVPQMDDAGEADGAMSRAQLAMRSYGYSADPQHLVLAREELAKVQNHVGELTKLSAAHPELDFLKAKLPILKTALADYTAIVALTEKDNLAIAQAREALDTRATHFNGQITALIAKQQSLLLEEVQASAPAATLTERTRKIILLGEINHAVDTARIATFKAQSLGNPKLFTIALDSFATIDKTYSEVLALVQQPADQATLAESRRDALAYRDTLAKLRDASLHVTEASHRRMERGAQVNSLSMEIVDDGISHTVKTADASADALASALSTLHLGLFLSLGLALGVAWFITRAITRPIHACVAAVQRLAQGDLTASVNLKRDDELGTLASAIDDCIANLRALVGDLKKSSIDLRTSAQNLSATATNQAAAAEETTVQAHSVASAGEELSVNARTMASSAGQITQSTSTVAAAMEEMSSSIQEVARNCAQESEIARKADTQARATRELMAKLDDSARQIGKVVELINRIAQQTNLLALNATIEAASAGEAGRGFAVVANEVKELANQSAAATEDIRKQVALIQDGAGSSMRSLDEVAKIIEQVAHISSSIAAAVDQQSATTSEIVGTIHNVSTATTTLSQNVQQTSHGAAEVARNISGVSQAAAEGAKGATRISASATELNALSTTLGQLVAKFKV